MDFCWGLWRGFFLGGLLWLVADFYSVYTACSAYIAKAGRTSEQKNQSPTKIHFGLCGSWLALELDTQSFKVFEWCAGPRYTLWGAGGANCEVVRSLWS
jgi:hypothetical protein